MRVGFRDFSLYLRPRRNGRPVYYARFRNDDGSWTSGNSTGQTVRTLAEGWATAEAKHRAAQAAREEMEPQTCSTRASFAGADFFGYDGRWALDLRATGKRPSPRQCREKRQTYEKHVLPVVGEVKLHQVNRALLKDFRNDMFQGSYSSSTINRALDCIRAVLEAAEDEERIPAVPRLDRAAGRSVERGTPSAAEFRRTFTAQWEDPRAYFASALAAVSGLSLLPYFSCTPRSSSVNASTISFMWFFLIV